MKTATAKKPKQESNELALVLSMDQYQRLERVWYAIGELSDLISPPQCEDGGLECLRLVTEELGDVIHEFKAQVEKGGAA